MELLSIILVIASLLPFSTSDRQGLHTCLLFVCFFIFLIRNHTHSIICKLVMINKGASFVGLGDALYDMKLKLNATANQLTDWNQNQVNPCTWNSVICDTNNNVVQV
jgi:hypothetical protein